MKILWLAPYPIWPPFHGGKIRVYNLASRIAKRGHDVEVWCITAEPRAQPDPVIGRMSFRFFDLRERRSAPSKLKALVSPLPTPAWMLRTPAVRGALSGADFDVAVMEQAQCGSLLPALQRTEKPWMFDAHNVESHLYAQISSRIQNPITRYRFRLDAAKFRRLEQSLLREATAVVAVSGADASLLQALAPSARIDVCPNGVDTRFFEFVDHSKVRAANLLMTGTLGYLPNQDAAIWLLKEILPLVRRRLPEIRLELVGGLATTELLHFDQPEVGVRIVGEVPDVRPHMRRADVFVIPIRVGSGTRLKALEALASGLPIVATRKAVEGLGLEERGLVVLGDTAAELADGIERAISDGDLRARLVNEGRRYVEECFDWDRIALDFESRIVEQGG